MHTHKVLYRGLAIVVTGMMLLAGCLWLLNTAQAANRGSSSALSSLEATGKYILVDDFKDGDWWNYCGGNEYCWEANGGSISCSIQTTPDDGFLEMQYNVIPTTAIALFTSELTKCGSLAALDKVWVAVKGESGSEPIYIEFKDCGPHHPKQLIGDYLAQGITTTGWSAVAIPLTAFDEITDWTCIERLNIMASNEITSGQGTIYVDDIRLLPARVLVDDFHDAEPENELGGTSDTWAYSGTIVYDYPDGVLELDYNVITPTCAATYLTKLRYTNLLSQKDALFFKIRGDQGSEEIAVEFKDCGLSGWWHYPKVKVSDYLVGGITTDWRGVAIPLAAFADDMDWTCVEYIGFYVSADSCFNSGRGKVYVDDVVLAPTLCPIPLIVDHFDDCNDCNALIGAWNCSTSGTANIDCAPDPVHRYGNDGCGYQITYDVEGKSSAWVYSELKGLDVTDYTHLRFLLKGAAGGEALHVYLGDSENERYRTIVADDNWQAWMLPLSYFSPTVDLTSLSELKIAFEWRTMAGEVYLDDISFMRPCTTFLPIVMRGYCGCGPDNYEPNDSCNQAYGSLTSGQTYQSYISCCDVATYKKSDYFYIDISTTNAINIYLTDIPAGTDYDLCLYRNPSDDPNNPAACSRNDGNSPEMISYNPPATGRYYIRVYAHSGYSASPYSLQVTYD